jgi:hypothetical protein
MSRRSRNRWMFVAALAGAAFGCGTAVAHDGYGYYELPPGPYRQECRHERVEAGYLLLATCPKRDGAMRDASLDLRTCPRGAPVYNDGAYLRCGSGGYNFGAGYNTSPGYNTGYGYSLPPGPYRQECRYERVEGGYLLRATCPRRDGAMRDASLDLRTCPRGAPVYNDGAYLRCGAGSAYGPGSTGWFGAGGYGVPPGPYRYQCRGERIVDGYLLVASCPKRDGEMRGASLDLRSCPRGAPIYNEGAYLRCR